ncbi:MAG: DEAD/DEAH box helicase family protein, partial [Bacteroidales bacterium]|nr:DEAD/DEAH box helicase family protein [Bacteroidales bacterium]
MLIDNNNNNPSIQKWIKHNTSEGIFNTVTGYFTIGALAFLSREINDKVNKFNFILGDFVHDDLGKEHGVDLLNENISAEGAFQLSTLAQKAVNFLNQDKVVVKTFEPNFCHAKAYMFQDNNNSKKDSYFITGSSNLTEAGIGLRKNQNEELNIADTGMSAQFNEIEKWFDRIWTSDKAKTHITVTNPTTEKQEKKHFKNFLIEEIQKIFRQYTPYEVFYKILFELFGKEILIEQEDKEFNHQMGKLHNTKVYQSLYPFQKRGVHALVKMLLNYNGAILGDAVGLGKTWSALAVIKYFEMRGYTSVVLCPKKLQQNWEKFLEEGNLFSKDNFDYKIRFHTDLQDERWNRYTGKQKFNIEDFTSDKPKLLVIDESHNLRNDKSNRYKFLLNEFLQKASGEVKILMLSATPINNSLIDIRNQLRLITQGNDQGFYDSIGIRNIDYLFRRAQHRFNEWRELPNPTIGEFIKMLPSEFFRLTDSLVVARTRKIIKGLQSDLVFPKVEKPDNVFVTPSEIGNFESFDELYDHFPEMLSGYQPSAFLNGDEEFKKSILENERQRDFFLVKMMYILMVKRLESSWYSFYQTVSRVLAHHQNALNRILEYQKTKKEMEAGEDSDEVLEDDDDVMDQLDQYTLGKKRLTKLSDIEKAGNLEIYKKKLKEDIDRLELLVSNLGRFEKQIEKETDIPNNKSSKDSKLEVLIDKINKKRANPANNNNLKVVIFTAYKDTGEYLFSQLKKRGFQQMAFVSGDYSRTTYSEHTSKKYEPILQQFAPFTKLFKEMEWSYNPSGAFMNEWNMFQEWQGWLKENSPKDYEKLTQPIDILIATDALSEGQNLQDSDMVMNYDIHWNPVRIIQRMGRIDRLGSPNDAV